VLREMSSSEMLFCSRSFFSLSPKDPMRLSARLASG
jgi:hypothetical protein